MPNIIEIIDFSSPELDVFARLTEPQLRRRSEPEKGVFIAESEKVINLALDAGCEPLALLAERRLLDGQARGIAERCADIPIYTADRELLSGLTGFALSRGVLCAMRRPQPLCVEEVCAGAKRVAVLEGVMDSTNVGALFRSAAALGIDAVLLAPTCCDPLLRRAVRVSMGTVFRIPWARVCGEPEEWPRQGMERLRGLGFKSAAMALSDGAREIDDPQIMSEKRLAIVFGAEGDGLAADTIAECDYTARIPMSHNVDSLNVAAAAAIAFWQLRVRD